MLPHAVRNACRVIAAYELGNMQCMHGMMTSRLHNKVEHCNCWA